MKTFLPYFLYTLVRETYYRRHLTSKQEGQEKKVLIFEKPVPCIDENRRIVAVGGTNSFLYYLRCLRDSFPNDDRFQFSWGGFQANDSASFLLFSNCLKARNLCFTMENPIIGRHCFNDLTTRDQGYFRVAFYESAIFNRGIFNIPHQVDATRFNQILQATHSQLKPYREKGEHIIYALQVPYDRSLVGLDAFVAAQYDLVALRLHTSRKIIVTVNPAMMQEWWAIARLRNDVAESYEHLKKLCKFLDIEIYDSFKKAGEDSSIFLPNCWCVVCHSSGFAVDAMLAGVPAITLHRGSFVYPICSHDLSEVENPKMPDRIPWFSRLAYCQWTLSEIKNGDVYRHFRPVMAKWLEENPNKKPEKDKRIPSMA